MSTITRKLIALDMLHQDMADEWEALCEQTLPPHYRSEHHSCALVPAQYLKLLARYLEECRQIIVLAKDLKDSTFSDLVLSSGAITHFSNKQMLLVQCRLLEYVLAFYSASHKADKILASEFGDRADKRLDLLQTKAIKARSQFKTVALAMGKSDYQEFKQALCLPQADWGWQVFA